MLGSILEKMATQESTPGGGRFSASSSTATGNDASAYSDPCAPGEDYSTATRNDSQDNTQTFDPSNKDERLGGEPSTLVQCAQCTSGNLDG
jgi:hypothetical protein